MKAHTSIQDRKIVIKEIDTDHTGKQQVVYASQYYQIELHTAQMLHELNVKDTAEEEVLQEKIKQIQRAEKIDLDDIHELERWIENCMRDGFAKAQEIATDKMKPLMGGLGNLGLGM